MIFSKFSRYKWLAVLLTVFAVVIAIQMITIQTSSHAAILDEWAQDYGYERRTIESERGYIYDRWGHLLAGNKEVYEVGVELQFVRNPASIAAALSAMLGADYGDTLAAASQPYDTPKKIYDRMADIISTEKIEDVIALK
jgi:cell division protein FtsI/penicillin-binding protein 2